MKSIFKTAIICSLMISATCVAGCSSDDTEGAAITEEDAKSVAATFTGGTAVEATFVAEEDLWDVDVTLPVGDDAPAEVEVTSSGEVIEVKADEPPFDYDISFIDGTLTLEEATVKAKELKDGTVTIWEFKLGDDGKYFWEFYIVDSSDSLWEIKITSDTGEEIEVELKGQAD